MIQICISSEDSGHTKREMLLTDVSSFEGERRTVITNTSQVDRSDLDYVSGLFFELCDGSLKLFDFGNRSGSVDVDGVILCSFSFLPLKIDVVQTYRVVSQILWTRSLP